MTSVTTEFTTIPDMCVRAEFDCQNPWLVHRECWPSKMFTPWIFHMCKNHLAQNTSNLRYISKLAKKPNKWQNTYIQHQVNILGLLRDMKQYKVVGQSLRFLFYLHCDLAAASGNHLCAVLYRFTHLFMASSQSVPPPSSSSVVRTYESSSSL